MPRMTSAEYHAFLAAQKAAKKADRLQSANDASECESELHGQIMDECRRRGWIPLHGSMAHRSKRTLGEPDFVIPIYGRVLFVEAKTKTGKLTMEQQAYGAYLAKHGHTLHVVRSLQDFLAIL